MRYGFYGWVYPIDISPRCSSLKTVEVHFPGGKMEKTTLFKSNRSQAVRLPKAVAFPEDVTHVEIVSVGRARIITPAGECWDSWFDGECVADDFMAEREQPDEQVREDF